MELRTFLFGGNGGDLRGCFKVAMYDFPLGTADIDEGNAKAQLGFQACFHGS